MSEDIKPTSIAVFGTSYPILGEIQTGGNGKREVKLDKGKYLHGQRIFQMAEQAVGSEDWEWSSGEEVEERVPEPQEDERERIIRIMTAQITQLKMEISEWQQRYDYLLGAFVNREERAKPSPDIVTVDGSDYKAYRIETVRIARIQTRVGVNKDGKSITRKAVQRSIESFDGRSSSSGIWKWVDEERVEKIKPIPCKCGGVVDVVDVGEGDGFYAICTRCRKESDQTETEEEAIRYWNEGSKGEEE